MLQSSYPSVESVLSGTREGFDMQEAFGLLICLKCRILREGFILYLLHILWDCVGVSKMWAYIITQWTRTEISSAQMVLYKQAALLRSVSGSPSKVKADIKQVFQITMTSLAEPGKNMVD